MIIGNGNISSVIQDRKDVTFWCSGVSNSAETRLTEFKREMDMVIEYALKNQMAHLVYFSSLSVYRQDDPYNQHKKMMERVVRGHFRSYTIVRVEVISWGRNPTTIHNIFRAKLAAGELPRIDDTFRYVVTPPEFNHWLSLIPVGEKTEMNIPGIRYSIAEILEKVKGGEL